MENLMLKFLVRVVLAVMFGSSLVASLAPNYRLKAPPGYEPLLGGGLGFLKLHREPLVWYDALVNCRLDGGTLASPVDSSLLISLLNMTWGLPGTHVGVRAKEGQTYFTLDGVELAKLEMWANWAVVVPLGTERCMILRPDGTLKAHRCNTKKHPYVCFRNTTEFYTQGFNECGTLDDGYRLYQSTGTCYKLHKMGMPWARAVLSCQAEGGNLLIIKNKAEAEIASEIGFVPTTTIYVAHYSSYKTHYHIQWSREREYEESYEIYEWYWEIPVFKTAYHWTVRWHRWFAPTWYYATITYISTSLMNPSTTTPPHPYFDQEIFLGIYRTDSQDFMTIHGTAYNDIEGYKEFHSSASNYYPSLLCGGYWPRNMKIYALPCHHFHRYICEKKP